MKKEKTKVKEVKNLGKNKKNKGITLIALVVTIIALLILAGVAINLTIGQNGIFTKAQEAAIVTAVASVKEEIELEKGGKLIGNEALTPEDMVSEGKANRMVSEDEDGTYQMYYALKEGAYKGMQNFGKGEISSLKDVFLIDDSLHVKYISSDGKEYGDELEEKVLNDDTEITFASKEFEDYVKKISGVTDGKLRFKWMKEQTKLVIADVSITSLEDLVFFPELIELYIGSYNSTDYPNTGRMYIDSLSGIENCKKLESLKLTVVNINDLSQISNCSNLKNFEANSGVIKDFTGLGQCLNLQVISIGSVTDVNKKSLLKETENLSKIRSFSFGNNNEKIEKISELSKLKSSGNITSLIINDNQINDLSGIENFTNLKTLNLQNNDISDITPLASLDNLTDLNLSGNSKINGDRSYYENNGTIDKIDKIGEILNRNGKITLDQDKIALFNNYKTMSLRGQGLKTLDILEGMTQITSLDLYGNDITLEDEESRDILKKMTNLQSLTLQGNKNIKDFSVLNEMTSLKSLNLYDTGVNLKQIEDIISNLDSLSVNANEFATITNCDENKISRLKITLSSQQKLEAFPDLSKFQNITELSIHGARADDYSCISKLKNVEKLDLQDCDLQGKMIDLSNFTHLQELNLKNNYLSSTDLQKLIGLKNNKNMKIYLDNNSIIDISNLLVLDPSTRITLSGNANITEESKNTLREHFGNNVTF